MSESQIKVTYEDHMGDDLKVVNAARASFNKRSTLVYDEYVHVDPNTGEHLGTEELFRLSDKDIKLTKYLAREKHIAPFGHNFLTVIVEAPIFVRSQLAKHKFLRMSEVSRRYVDGAPEFYEPDVWRKRAENVKQGSSDEAVELDRTKGYHGLNYTIYNDIIVDTCETYKQLLEAGVCPEQARMVLPQSMMTLWWWSGSMDAFADMCRLRLDSHAQYETRLVAQQVDKIASDLWPVSWKELLRGE